MKIKYYTTLCLCLMLLGACAVKKATSSFEGATLLSKGERKHFLTTLSDNILSYQTLQGKARAKVDINKKSFNTSATIRIQHQKSIWISFTSLLSLEVARVMITPERIQVLNRLNRSYIDQPFESINQHFAEGISFDELEQVLTGQSPVYAQQSQNDIFAITQGYQLSGTLQSINYELLYDQNAILTSNTLQDSTNNKKLQITYKDFEAYAGGKLPHTVNIHIKSPDQALDVSLNYASLRFDATVETPFSIPNNYKQIAIP